MNIAVSVSFHDRGFHAWCQPQAHFLRAGEPGKADEACFAARLEAARETRLTPAAFPATCPYLYDQIMDEGHWPGPASTPDISRKS